MNWINLNVTVLDSEEFLGAEPTERATWLCLLRYCVGQENGGRIVDARDWKDRKWQQVVRVTQKEIAAQCELWTWEGNDLVVAYYPEESEQRVRQKRDTAKTNGARGGRPKKTDTVTQPETQTETEEKPTLVISEKAERKGKEKEGKGNEREREDAHALAPEKSPTPEPPANAWSDRMPSEAAQDFDKLQSRINALHPSWAKRPHFSRMEQEELFSNSRIFFDIKEQDWTLLTAYMAVEIPEGWTPKFWQPDNRSILLKSVTDVLSHADRWKRECKRRGVATGLEGGAA